ncbi:MAG: autotransporter domain-containing protein [Phascolarctobacterium sp.]|nr:autotransporter domain-containing protein [Phascolarctobacterium sp.]
MSKKMLKRSLALGALMAFVITGSAMAAEVNYETKEERKALVNYDDPTGNTLTKADVVTHIVSLNGNDIVIKAEDSNKEIYIGDVKQNDEYYKGFNTTSDALSKTDEPHSIYAVINNGEVIGTGVETITLSENGEGEHIKAQQAYSKTSVTNVKTIKIEGEAANYIYATDKGEIELKDIDSIEGSTTGRVFQVGTGANIKVEANKINIEDSYRAVNASSGTIYLNTVESISLTSSGKNPTVEASDGAIVSLNSKKVNITSDYKGDSADVRINAILATGAGTSVTLTGNANVTAANSVGRADAIKVDGGTLTFTDSATITTTTTATDKQAYGIVAMNQADVNLADTKITTTGKGLTIGVVGSNGADIDLTATTINATSEGSRADGMNLENATVSVTGKLTIDATGKADSDKFGAQGVRLAESTAQFADVDISVKSTTDGTVYGIRMLGDNNTTSTQLDISGNADVYAETNGVAYGIIVSTGANVDLKDDLSDVGENLKVTVKGKEKASAIRAQYGSDINVSADTDVDIIATSENGNAYGVVNSYLTYDSANYAKANANISILGNVNIEANGKTGSYAVYNSTDYNKVDVEEVGNTIIGSQGKKVTITGDMYANSGSITTTFGAEGSQFDGKVETVDSGTTTLNFANGSIWNLTGASTLTNATFDEGSTLVIDGKTYEKDKGVYALNGVGKNATLNVTQGAKLTVEGIDYNTYNIAKGFSNITAAKDKWDVTNLNTLMQGVWTADATNGLQLEVVAKEADQMATEMGVSSSTAQFLNEVTTAAQSAGVEGNANGTGTEKAVALVEAMAKADSKVAGQAFEAVSKMAEAGGNSGTAASIVKNVTGVTNDRLSFNCGHSAPHKGGHGVGLLEEGSGADIWVEYVHGKDEVEDMPSTAGASSYEGQYNGIVMGVDFKKVNKFQSGLAFNYGEGDTNSVGSAARTHSDYDFWGIGYYGSIHNDDSNVIFDIGYAKTDSDVETKALGLTYNASPETTTWTAGVKVEKLYQNENVQIVPYTGLRYMSIDPEDYSTECASSKYDMERQNVWLLPLGVSIRQEIANDNGWTVSPKVDLSYIWAFGDTDSEMEFSTLGTKTNIGYEVMDDGSFLGLVGIEAHKGQWGFGVSYSYQKGDYSTSKKWFIDANYSF